MPPAITNDRGLSPELGPRGLRLDAAERWMVRGSGDELTEIERALQPGACDRLPDLLLLQFGNAVGIHLVPGVGPVDVYSGKFGERDFETMLEEITQALAALPFTAASAAHLPYDRSFADDPEVIYHAFAYLRHACSEASRHDERLPHALGLVVSQPHRRLERIARSVPLEAARRVEARSVVRAIAGGGRLQRAAGCELALARALAGHLPERIDESTPEPQIDTPENRFVKAFLRQALAIVDRIEVLAVAKPDGFFRRRVLADCVAIRRALGPAAQHPMWREVRTMTRPPFESTVLQRRRGYRDVLRHFVRLRMVARLRFDATALLEIKDIARLYEMWCFFAVQEEVASALGGGPDDADRPLVDELQARVPWGLRVAWRGRAELLYNPSFNRSSASRASYSLPLRPDILLRIHAGRNAGDHVLDPKFRLRRFAELAPDDGLDEDEQPSERLGHFKYGDLYKMHTYRDALPGVESVWVLYPGDIYRFFAAPGAEAGCESSVLSGVGAVPLVPTSHRPHLTRIVRTLLDVP